jgi:hypothetical protein
MRKILNKALQMIIGMIIIHLRFTGGSAGEEHDIAHIASSIMLPALCGLFFFLPDWRGSGVGCVQQNRSHTDVCSRSRLHLPPCCHTSQFEKRLSGLRQLHWPRSAEPVTY